MTRPPPKPTLFPYTTLFRSLSKRVLAWSPPIRPFSRRCARRDRRQWTNAAYIGSPSKPPGRSSPNCFPEEMVLVLTTLLCPSESRLCLLTFSFAPSQVFPPLRGRLPTA